MAPRFTITVDRQRLRLVIELGGFFGVDDVEAFAAAKAKTHHELACAPNQHVTLVDVSACNIQAQAVMQPFASLIADPAYRSRRLAFVVGSSLARLQVRRMTEGLGHVACFDDRASAEAWLVDDGAAREA